MGSVAPTLALLLVAVSHGLCSFAGWLGMTREHGACTCRSRASLYLGETVTDPRTAQLPATWPGRAAIE